MLQDVCKNSILYNISFIIYQSAPSNTFTLYTLLCIIGIGAGIVPFLDKARVYAVCSPCHGIVLSKPCMLFGPLFRPGVRARVVDVFGTKDRKIENQVLHPGNVLGLTRVIQSPPPICMKIPDQRPCQPRVDARPVGQSFFQSFGRKACRRHSVGLVAGLFVQNFFCDDILYMVFMI